MHRACPVCVPGWRPLLTWPGFGLVGTVGPSARESTPVGAAGLLGSPTMGGRQPLRVLIADHHPAQVGRITDIVEQLGHAVVAREIDVDTVAAVTAEEHPDVALVALGESGEHALAMID